MHWNNFIDNDNDIFDDFDEKSTVKFEISKKSIVTVDFSEKFEHFSNKNEKNFDHDDEIANNNDEIFDNDF